jgi:hypothetical protein
MGPGRRRIFDASYLVYYLPAEERWRCRQSAILR